ncbi:hypothetical protein C8R46DRAFT_1233861 [Mycena filopes]|nr:hypothetical protein C8R46DRAFT_1233861 [Mycena filopes]
MSNPGVNNIHAVPIPYDFGLEALTNLGDKVVEDGILTFDLNIPPYCPSFSSFLQTPKAPVFLPLAEEIRGLPVTHTLRDISALYLLNFPPIIRLLPVMRVPRRLQGVDSEWTRMMLDKAVPALDKYRAYFHLFERTPLQAQFFKALLRAGPLPVAFRFSPWREFPLDSPLAPCPMHKTVFEFMQSLPGDSIRALVGIIADNNRVFTLHEVRPLLNGSIVALSQLQRCPSRFSNVMHGIFNALRILINQFPEGAERTIWLSILPSPSKDGFMPQGFYIPPIDATFDSIYTLEATEMAEPETFPDRLARSWHAAYPALWPDVLKTRPGPAKASPVKTPRKTTKSASHSGRLRTRTKTGMRLDATQEAGREKDGTRPSSSCPSSLYISPHSQLIYSMRSFPTYPSRHIVQSLDMVTRDTPWYQHPRHAALRIVVECALDPSYPSTASPLQVPSPPAIRVSVPHLNRVLGVHPIRTAAAALPLTPLVVECALAAWYSRVRGSTTTHTLVLTASSADGRRRARKRTTKMMHPHRPRMMRLSMASTWRRRRPGGGWGSTPGGRGKAWSAVSILLRADPHRNMRHTGDYTDIRGIYRHGYTVPRSPQRTVHHRRVPSTPATLSTDIPAPLNTLSTAANTRVCASSTSVACPRSSRRLRGVSRAASMRIAVADEGADEGVEEDDTCGVLDMDARVGTRREDACQLDLGLLIVVSAAFLHPSRAVTLSRSARCLDTSASAPASTGPRLPYRTAALISPQFLALCRAPTDMDGCDADALCKPATPPPKPAPPAADLPHLALSTASAARSLGLANLVGSEACCPSAKVVGRHAPPPRLGVCQAGLRRTHRWLHVGAKREHLAVSDEHQVATLYWFFSSRCRGTPFGEVVDVCAETLLNYHTKTLCALKKPVLQVQGEMLLCRGSGGFAVARRPLPSCAQTLLAMPIHSALVAVLLRYACGGNRGLVCSTNEHMNALCALLCGRCGTGVGTEIKSRHASKLDFEFCPVFGFGFGVSFTSSPVSSPALSIIALDRMLGVYARTSDSPRLPHVRAAHGTLVSV